MRASRAIARRLAAAALRGSVLGIALALLAIGLVAIGPEAELPADPAMPAVAAADGPQQLDAAARMARAGE